MRVICALFLAVALAACASAHSENADGAEQAWHGAWVAFPVGFANLEDVRVERSLASAAALGKKALKPWPTVVYFHGCKGHVGSSKVALKALAGAGFVVIAPDSFAREGRPETCDPKRHRQIKGAPRNVVTTMRLEEISFAAEAAPKLAWVDKRNLFLYGHSQGGRVVAAYSGAGFKAVATSGSRCPAGVGAPATKPGLYMNAARDPWFHGKKPPGKCREAGPPGAMHEHPVFDTDDHVVLRSPAARERLISFFKSHLD